MLFCMDWSKTGFDWNRARAFLVTAEEGSFSAAGRALGLAQPTLGRQVAALEAELGVTLFERMGPTLALTPTGLALLVHVRAMSEAAMRLSLAAAGQEQTAQGLVRVAASEAVAAYLLPPVIDELRRDHPGIELEIVVSNQLSDLKRREADIAVRHARPSGDDLVARMISDQTLAYLYASPGYLRRIGNPQDPAALAADAQVFAFDDSAQLLEGLRALGLPLTEANLVITTDNHLVQWELAKRGLGICVMMEQVGTAESRVRRVLPKHLGGVPFPTWLVSHRELRTSRRIRVVFDLLAERLSERLGAN